MLSSRTSPSPYSPILLTSEVSPAAAPPFSPQVHIPGIRSRWLPDAAQKALRSRRHCSLMGVFRQRTNHHRVCFKVSLHYILVYAKCPTFSIFFLDSVPTVVGVFTTATSGGATFLDTLCVAILCALNRSRKSKAYSFVARHCQLLANPSQHHPPHYPIVHLPKPQHRLFP